MINVCFFSGDITRSGGTERVSSMIANELVKDENFKISFLSLYEKNKETFFYLSPVIERHRLYDYVASGAKYLFGYISRTRKFLKKNKIDIIIDIDGILDMYSIPASVGLKTKVISWEQFNYYQNPFVNYRKLTRRLAARMADAIVVLTNKDVENYKNNLNIKNKIVCIYNGMQRVNYDVNYDLNSKIIVTAGRIAFEKGFDMLADVANIVLHKHNDWKWYILGEGEQRQMLEEKIKQNNLEGRLILKGNVSNIESYYEKAAIYVLTSRFEGFGLVLTEAKSYKLPCVSFKCPEGPAEIIIDKVNGYLVEDFDIEKMAEKILCLIENDEIRKEFSDRAIEGTDKFDTEKILEEWKKLLLSI